MEGGQVPEAADGLGRGTGKGGPGSCGRLLLSDFGQQEKEQVKFLTKGGRHLGGRPEKANRNNKLTKEKTVQGSKTRSKKDRR